MLRKLATTDLSAGALIAANVLPLFGVLFLGWEAFDIVAVYWVENVIAGVILLTKIALFAPFCSEENNTAQDSPRTKESRPAPRKSGGRRNSKRPRRDSECRPKMGWPQALVTHLIGVAGFAFIYGGYCVLCAIGICWVFGPKSIPNYPLDYALALFELIWQRHLGWAVAGLAASHLYSFFRDYIGRGEFRQIPDAFAFLPFARVALLFLAVWFGTLIALLLNSNIVLLALLILGKTKLDLNLHLNERQRSAAKPKSAMLEDALQESPQI